MLLKAKPERMVFFTRVSVRITVAFVCIALCIQPLAASSGRDVGEEPSKSKSDLLPVGATPVALLGDNQDVGPVKIVINKDGEIRAVGEDGYDHVKKFTEDGDVRWIRVPKPEQKPDPQTASDVEQRLADVPVSTPVEEPSQSQPVEKGEPEQKFDWTDTYTTGDVDEKEESNNRFNLNAEPNPSTPTGSSSRSGPGCGKTCKTVTKWGCIGLGGAIATPIVLVLVFIALLALWIGVILTLEVVVHILGSLRAFDPTWRSPDESPCCKPCVTGALPWNIKELDILWPCNWGRKC